MSDQEIEDMNYVGSFRRGSAAMIDILIVGTLRVVFAQILWSIWFSKKVAEFQLEFQNEFGIDIIGNNPERIEFLINHQIFKYGLLFLLLIVLIGALYHALFDSSSWSATVGKRVVGAILVNNDGKSLSFFESLMRYFLSLVPWFFTIYIAIYTAYHKISFFDALTVNKVNLILGLATVVWIQINVLTKKKVTTHDLICKTVVIDGRIGGFFPKFKLV